MVTMMMMMLLMMMVVVGEELTFTAREGARGSSLQRLKEQAWRKSTHRRFCFSCVNSAVDRGHGPRVELELGGRKQNSTASMFFSSGGCGRRPTTDEPVAACQSSWL